MNFYTIENLKTDVAQNNLYSFFDATFQYLKDITMYSYIVQEHQTMRIDVICNEIYKDTRYCDFLLSLNGIDNPLNIMLNDTILYVDQQQIRFFNLDESTAKSLRNTYLNSNKVAQQDPNRAAYIQNNYSLPPTFLDIPASSVQVTTDGKIYLGGNT